MLGDVTRNKIVETTDAFWTKQVQELTFASLVDGKEPGHRMADYVDDKTVSLLKVGFDTRYEADRRGRLKGRSMGDVWIHSNGIYNPVNVKSGEQMKSGQPNLVSMQKLLDYLFRRWIDSYYLLIVKFRLAPPIAHRVYLIDLLDWLDFVAFDAGPGQIMLREADFYDAYEGGARPSGATIQGKVEKLFSRFEDATQRLFNNRQKRLDRQRGLLKAFTAESAFVVDQSSMHFVP